MKIRTKIYISSILFCLLFSMGTKAQKGNNEWELLSPDKNIKFVVFTDKEKKLSYTVTLDNQVAVEPSQMGLIIDNKNMGTDAQCTVAGTPKEIKESYELKVGKKLKTTNHCNERVLTFKDNNGIPFNIVMRAYDDGIAFRYELISKNNAPQTINEELTEFAIPTKGKAWVYPYVLNDRKRYSYEEYCEYGIPIGTAAKDTAGWSYPMLFETNGMWIFVTEAYNEGNYPATHVDNSGKNGAYKVRFPEMGEAVYASEPSEAIITLPWQSPWRSIVIGKDLNTIFRTQMVSHLNPASVIKDDSWVKPGRSSWSWWSEKRVRSYNRQVKYADLSKHLRWEYMLIDAGWPNMKDGGTMEDVVKYASEQGVGTWLWYASLAGEENNPSPEKRVMTDPNLRKEEFGRIHKLGVKGIKVDFFDTDKQKAMKLYRDILKDAADNQLMVDFHGCTLPRGWERTYPNLVAMEAVKGAEGMGQQLRCDEAPAHHTALVFMRNVVGSMDYTPVIFSIKNPTANTPGIPKTTYAHQLGLSVVFECGFQCFADNEKTYMALPDKVKEFLRIVPTTWDESMLIEGYPGDHAIILRKKGNKWFIGGINGKAENKNFTFTLPKECQGKKLSLILDGKDKTSFDYQNIPSVNGSVTIQVLEQGGFAGIIE